MKFSKFLRAHCFTEHLHWLLLEISDFQCAILLKKRLRQRCFCMNFLKFLRIPFLLTEHLRMTASWVYVWILRSFSKHFFYRAPRGNCYFMYKLQNFAPSDLVKSYFTHDCRAFYRRSRSSQGVHLLKIPENCLWRS